MVEEIVKNENYSNPYIKGIISGFFALVISFGITFIFILFGSAFAILDNSTNPHIFGTIPGLIAFYLVGLYLFKRDKIILDKKIKIFSIIIYFVISYSYYFWNVGSLIDFIDAPFIFILVFALEILASYYLMGIPSKVKKE